MSTISIGRTLFRNQDGNATVIGLPKGFDVNYEIKQARSICLATAYARMSGWKYLEAAFHGSKATIYLLAGLDHYLTQPEVLRSWMQLAECPRIKSRVYILTNFHPKVLIVNGIDQGSSGNVRAFAVVGSGNLSEGGLRTNIECSVLADDIHYVRKLNDWFQSVFEKGRPITADLIKAYEPLYLKARHSEKQMQSHGKQLFKGLARRKKASDKRDLEEVVESQAKFFVVNTNIENNEDDHNHMLIEHEACAFYDPWKYGIEKISKGDVVFLYESRGPGIVAFGAAKWEKADKRNHDGIYLEAYCMGLKVFRRIDPPISASELKKLDSSEVVFRRAVEEPSSSLGRKLYETALNRSG